VSAREGHAQRGAGGSVAKPGWVPCASRCGLTAVAVFVGRIRHCCRWWRWSLAGCARGLGGGLDVAGRLCACQARVDGGLAAWSGRAHPAISGADRRARGPTDLVCVVRGVFSRCRANGRCPSWCHGPLADSRREAGRHVTTWASMLLGAGLPFSGWYWCDAGVQSAIGGRSSRRLAGVWRGALRRAPVLAVSGGAVFSRGRRGGSTVLGRWRCLARVQVATARVCFNVHGWWLASVVRERLV